jgi:hypothetical protein
VDKLSDEIKLLNAKISDDIQHQNIIILGLQKEFQDSFSDFSMKLQELYKNTSSTTVSPSASTSNQGQWGTRAK